MRLPRRAGGSPLLVVALLATVLASLAVPTPAHAARAEAFPDGYAGYHTYDEMMADINVLISARPNVVAKRSIGRSHEGRTIWAVKISDNVGRDENEPEVLFEHLSHAREHLSGEMALRIIHLLVDNYRARAASITTPLQARVSAIVRTREIWIVPMVNPDGAEFDVAGDSFARWRKNRQPIPGSSAIGVDLNRNWGYKWGCCRGSSGNPADNTYRGPRAWFAPEVAALRDFVLGRRVNGVQQIRAAISWHTFNEEIMWPYGYTRADLPRDMSPDDLDAFRAVGFAMAERNGYTPQQLSDLYVLDGGSTDWLYGDQRIFAYTIEMYPRDDVPVPAGFYPRDDVIERETTRNDGAVLYFLEQADCPYRAAGLLSRCGPLNDDFETGRGWSVNPNGSDSATRGRFERASPARTATSAGVKQARYGFSALDALVTGAAAGGTAGANDLDGGVTSASSPLVQLGASGTTGWRLEFRYSLAHSAAASGEDYLRILINGIEVWREAARPAERNASWMQASVSLDAYAGQRIRVLVEAADMGADALVEAALDDIRIFRQP